LDATGKVVKHAMRSEELVTRNDKKPLVCEWVGLLFVSVTNLKGAYL
jgi:hypothetical protein